MRIRLRLVAVPGVVVALAAGGLAALLLTGHATVTATSSATTATVKRGTVAQTVSAAGTVQAASTRGLSFGTSGTVTVLGVKAGDAVTAGQVLAKIDDSDAQDAVDSAQTAVDSAETALARAKASASATPSASSANASAAPGGNRSGGSGGSGGGSGATTDSLMSAQQQLNNAELALSQAKQALAGTVITAPAAGRVLTVNGGVGDTETPGSTPFLSLGAASDTVVSASFTESDVAQLAVGQAATVTLPDKGTQSYTGKVSQVDPVGTASDKLVRYSVLIAFDQPPADLLYGQSANVAVTTASASGVLYLPSTAVTSVDNGTATVTVRTGGVEESRTVHIGLRGDRYTEIRSGLDEGQTVVVGG
jgi:multidrug efflux pump subunit AcrA (membrane-fusion protein)